MTAPHLLRRLHRPTVRRPRVTVSLPPADRCVLPVPPQQIDLLHAYTYLISHTRAARPAALDQELSNCLTRIDRYRDRRLRERVIREYLALLAVWARINREEVTA